MDKKNLIVIGYGEKTGIYVVKDNGEVEKQDLERGGPERVMRFSLISRQLRWLEGEMLTVAEATLEGKKLEATKKLIKDKFANKISWMYELCGTPEDEQDSLNDPEDTD